MDDFDEAVVKCFLEQQTKLFSRPVATDMESARDFLEECLAVVLSSPKEVLEYFEEEGFDVAGVSAEDILEAEEVFKVGDGRYLIVEG